MEGSGSKTPLYHTDWSQSMHNFSFMSTPHSVPSATSYYKH